VYPKKGMILKPHGSFPIPIFPCPIGGVRWSLHHRTTIGHTTRVGNKDLGDQGSFLGGRFMHTQFPSTQMESSFLSSMGLH